MNDILLSAYQPKSECVVQEHLIMKPRFPVVDIHMHMGSLVLGKQYEERYDTKVFIRQLDEYGIKHLVNLDGAWGDERDRMFRKIGDHGNTITTFVWIDVSKIDEPHFAEMIRTHLRSSYQKGARGIKMWKDISLNQKDKSGAYIRTDDPRLDVVYETAAELKIPVLLHIADPVAFFKPIDAYNERFEELHANPDWSFLKEDQYSFAELMEMQDRMIASHPNTTFIIAHCGSYSENLAHVAQRLDRFPNMYIDIAARIAELGRVPYSARAFFLKYQDRILYGTDCTPLDLSIQRVYFRFLETFDEYFEYQQAGEQPGQGRWRIYGIGLPDEVLKKVYYQNACKILGLDEHKITA